MSLCINSKLLSPSQSVSTEKLKKKDKRKKEKVIKCIDSTNKPMESLRICGGFVCLWVFIFAFPHFVGFVCLCFGCLVVSLFCFISLQFVQLGILSRENISF